MKVIVIGATGTIGSAVADALEAKDHEVVKASRTGPVRVDLTDPATIEALFEQVDEVDAVVCCAASGALRPLTPGTDEHLGDFRDGITGKLFGQVALVRGAAAQLRDGGSVTLTSGRFDKSMEGAAFGAMVNAGLESFVASAADQMPRGLRVNTISPGWISESLERMGSDSEEGTPVVEVAQAYVEAVEGTMRGRTLNP